MAEKILTLMVYKDFDDTAPQKVDIALDSVVGVDDAEDGWFIVEVENADSKQGRFTSYLVNEIPLPLHDMVSESLQYAGSASHHDDDDFSLSNE